MLALSGGIIRIEDLFPDVSSTQNAYSSFFVTAMDYRYRNNSMRVAIDTPDRRFDAILKQKGILASEMISR